MTRRRTHESLPERASFYGGDAVRWFNSTPTIELGAGTIRLEPPRCTLQRSTLDAVCSPSFTTYQVCLQDNHTRCRTDPSPKRVQGASSRSLRPMTHYLPPSRKPYCTSLRPRCKYSSQNLTRKSTSSKHHRNPAHHPSDGATSPLYSLTRWHPACALSPHRIHHRDAPGSSENGPAMHQSPQLSGRSQNPSSNQLTCQEV